MKAPAPVSRGFEFIPLRIQASVNLSILHLFFLRALRPFLFLSWYPLIVRPITRVFNRGDSGVMQVEMLFFRWPAVLALGRIN